MTKISRAYSYHHKAEVFLRHFKRVKIKFKTNFKRNYLMFKMIKDIEFIIIIKVNLQVIKSIKIWIEIILMFKKNLKILNSIKI
jgi:hypothetical protein